MSRMIAVALLVLGLAPSATSAKSISIGVFGGTSIPIVQDDNGSGPLFGVRAPVKLLPLITVEPFYSSTQCGDKTQDINGTSFTRSGFDIKSFGANAMLTLGGPVAFYPFVGIGSHSLSRTGSADETLTGYSFGLGVGISPVQSFTIHVRGEFDNLRKGGSGRAFAAATAGVSYRVFNVAAK